MLKIIGLIVLFLVCILVVFMQGGEQKILFFEGQQLDYDEKYNELKNNPSIKNLKDNLTRDWILAKDMKLIYFELNGSKTGYIVFIRHNIVVGISKIEDIYEYGKMTKDKSVSYPQSVSEIKF